MDVSIYSLKRNAKLQSWYEDMEERKSRNMTILEWCEYRGYSKSTYHIRQRKVLKALEEQLNKKDTPVEFAALPAPEEVKSPVLMKEKVVLRLKDLTVEIPDGTSKETILALMAGMKC